MGGDGESVNGGNGGGEASPSTTPKFPDLNGVLFFGRLFLKSLDQVDREILSAYEVPSGGGGRGDEGDEDNE